MMITRISTYISNMGYLVQLSRRLKLKLETCKRSIGLLGQRKPKARGKATEKITHELNFLQAPKSPVNFMNLLELNLEHKRSFI